MSKRLIAVGVVTILIFVAGLVYMRTLKETPNISEEQYQTVEVYFSKAGENLDCGEVFSVEREVLATSDTKYAAIYELLSGPTEQEEAQGFVTNINNGVVINNIEISNGVAKVDFDQKLGENVAGSCRVIAIRSQIENTLKQFSDINEVVISIEGNSEEILQP